MEINNEIRRIKAKLKLFEEEGFNWVIQDLIDTYGVGLIAMEEVGTITKSLKMHYLMQLEKLLPPDNKQGKLNI